MGLLFDADNERINCGNSAAVNNLTSVTICAWTYINTLAVNSFLLIKQNDDYTFYDYDLLFDASGNILANIGKVTTSTTAYSNDTPLTTGKWYFVAAVLNSVGADGDQHIYVGDLTTIAAEVGGYTLQRVGSGARTGGASDIGIGGYPGGTIAWINQDHIIAVVAIFNTSLSLGQIKSFQYHSREMANCVGLWFPGLHGTTNAPDLSGTGNNGTISNATLSTVHLPIFYGFGSDLGQSYEVAAPSVTIPIMIHHYKQAGGL